MEVRRLLTLAVLTAMLSGCATTSSSCENDSVNIGPLIGLLGMAVDGDDKDDYEYFFEDDCCKCSKCRH